MGGGRWGEKKERGTKEYRKQRGHLLFKFTLLRVSSSEQKRVIPNVLRILLRQQLRQVPLAHPGETHLSQLGDCHRVPIFNLQCIRCNPNNLAGDDYLFNAQLGFGAIECIQEICLVLPKAMRSGPFFNESCWIPGIIRIISFERATQRRVVCEEAPSTSSPHFPSRHPIPIR